MRRTIVASILAFAITVVSALALFAVPVLASSPGAYDSVLVGKGNAAHDIKAVQDAVDKGGKVLLKGTFDFGEKGRVNIKNDIEIIGETDTQAVPLTKIKGGFWTFHTPLPPQLPPQAPGPKITIQGIHFDAALWAPILVTYSSEATITGNRITNVQPILSKVPVFGREGIYWQQGVMFNPFFELAKEKYGYQPGLITGSLMVTDNDIDLTCEEPEKTLAQGVYFFWATGATIQVIRNRVTNCSKNSLEFLDNYLGEDGSGMTLIKDNTIVTATKGVPVPTPAAPNGIIAGWFLDLGRATDPVQKTKIIVMNNQIELRGATSCGISVYSDGGIICSNHIVVGGGPQAKGISQLASNSLIANNRIEGSGLCAALTMPFKSLKACGNIFVGNDFSRFKTSAADVLLQSSDNILMGKCGKVVDKGQRNLVLD
jgi:hypothetical protein